MAGHLECLAADLMRAGYSAREAKRRARIALGSTVVHKDAMRDSLGLRLMDELGADVRYGIRLLRKSPGFTAIAAISLALAIGANTTIFSVAKRLLLDRLDVPYSEQLRLLHWTGDKHVAVNNMWGISDDVPSGMMGGTSFTFPAYEQMRKDNRVLSDLFAFKYLNRMNATIDGSAQIVRGELVSGNYFGQVGVVPHVGRGILPSDDAQGASPVAVVSDAFWQRAFGGSPLAVGRVIRVNMVPVTVIGVTPRGFTGTESVQAAPDLFFPMSAQPLIEPQGKGGSLLGMSSPDMWWVNIMGRVKPGVSDAEAVAALQVSLSAAVRATHRLSAGDTLPQLGLKDGSRGLFFSKSQYGKPVVVLMAVVGLVLLLACANVASLLLARSAARQREISVRLALGAGRARVLRQALTESLLLSALGGTLGALLAFSGSQHDSGVAVESLGADAVRRKFRLADFWVHRGCDAGGGIVVWHCACVGCDQRRGELRIEGEHADSSTPPPQGAWRQGHRGLSDDAFDAAGGWSVPLLEDAQQPVAYRSGIPQ